MCGSLIFAFFVPNPPCAETRRNLVKWASEELTAFVPDLLMRCVTKTDWSDIVFGLHSSAAQTDGLLIGVVVQECFSRVASPIIEIPDFIGDDPHQIMEQIELKIQTTFPNVQFFTPKLFFQSHPAIDM